MAEPDPIRVCTACNQPKPADAFGKSKGYRDGLRRQCNQCRSAKGRTPAQRERARKWREANRERLRQEDRGLQKRYRYGLSLADIAAILSAQDGRCALCKTDRPGGRYGVFCVDHCHATGRVRGLLCHRCNVALGALGDGPEGLQAALDYVSGGAQ